MTEPRVCYKGLKEPADLFMVPRQPRPVAGAKLIFMAFLICASPCPSDAKFTSPTDEKDVRAERSVAMLNESSLPDVAISRRDLYKPSISTSLLPLSVEEDDDNNAGSRDSCSADQYWNKTLSTCRTCTTCGPGTQHERKEDCGYGRGSQQACEPCADEYYQDKTSSYLVRCRRCIVCDKHATIIQNCSREQNRKCGPCPPGMYPVQENNCLPCKEDPTREECRVTTPNPLELIVIPPVTPDSSSGSSVTSDASLSGPIVPDKGTVHTASANVTGTSTAGTENPTEPTTVGDENSTGSKEAVIKASLSALILVFGILAFVFRKQLRKRAPDACISGKESSSNNHEEEAVQVCFTVENEDIRYQAVPRPDRPDDTDLPVDQPQSLHSDLPCESSLMGAACEQPQSLRSTASDL